jgi:hypothetical protein
MPMPLTALFYQLFLAYISFKRGQIETSRLISVSVGLLSIRIFFRWVHIIKLTFLMPDGKKRKISFLSIEAKLFQDIFKIEMYRKLKEIAKNNQKSH